MPLPTSPPSVSDQAPGLGPDSAAEAVGSRQDRTFDGLLDGLLDRAVAAQASDLHLRAGAPALVRVRGDLWALDPEPLTSEQVEALVDECLERPRDRAAFRDEQQCDFALDRRASGRFRGSAYRERGHAAIVLRHVASEIPSLEDLRLPAVLERFAARESGLVIVAGPTGSGKSTTLAAMVSLINAQRRCHVLTIEDPIEYVHRDLLATVSQREVGTDTPSFASALRAAMRQDPDVICVGEIRDLETLRTALQAAETGHLVLASVHARTASDAVSRMCDLFPEGEQRQARTTIAEVLAGIACQRLVASADGTARVPAVELMVATPRIADAIVDPEGSASIGDVIAESAHYGMRSLQDDLVRLVLSGAISEEAAERVAISIADFRVALKRAGFRAQERRGA